MVLHRGGENGGSTAVDLIPTGEGDPVLEKWAVIPREETSIVLSDSAARKLNVSSGDEVVGRVGRSARGIREQASITLKVVAILPLEAFPRDAAFVRLMLLEASEDYRDGLRSEAFGWPGDPKPPVSRIYPSFRLYARSIYDVAALREQFLSQQVEVYTKAEDIQVVQSLDRSFSLIFKLIATIAVLGYFASMASNCLANVNRKARHLGITRLIGFSTAGIAWFPIIQAVATSFLGTTVAVCFYVVSEMVINRLFSHYLSAGEYVCKLSSGHLLMAFGFTVAMSVVASGYAASRVAKIEPSEVIRDV